MKYSKQFEETYNFYLRNINVFVFCGTLNPKHEAIYSKQGLSAKECFYCIESNGVNKPCCEPELLNSLLLCKASVNFQIKQWAESRAEGTLPLAEFSKTECISKNTNITKEDLNPIYVIDWQFGEPVKYSDIQTQYNLPSWVISAVEKQKYKFYKI